MGNTTRYLGIGLVLIGVLLFINIIPVGSTSQSVCAQSIVKQATYCAPPSSYVDSITFNGVVIAPALGSNPTGVTQNTGTLRAYYFLAQGATLINYGALYCQGLGCTPSISLTGQSLGTTAANLAYIQANSVSMITGSYYRYQFTIQDSLGTVSTLADGVIVVPATVNFVSTVNTVNGTSTIGGSPVPNNLVSGVNVYANENAQFIVQVNPTGVYQSSVLVSSISVYITPTAQTFQLNQIGGNTWQGYINFVPGTYTATATITLSNGNTQNAFSIRVLSIPPKAVTLATITTNSGGIVLTGSTTSTGTDGTATTVVSTATCGPQGCVQTTSTIVGKTTSVTVSTSSTVSVTTVGGTNVGGFNFGLGQVGGFLLIIVGGIFAFRKGKR